MCFGKLKNALTILVLIGSGLTSTVWSQTAKNRLASVSSLYIEAIDSGYIKERGKEFQNRLSKELAIRGFSTVTERTEADAVLSIEFSETITLDGDGSDPDYSIYEVFLYAQDQSLIKKWKIRIARHSSFDKADELAVKRIAEKLQKEKKKSLQS